MEAVQVAAIGKAVGEYGILGLGWALFLMMLFRELRERKRYSDLVIHIIQYFTKVRMVEHDESPILPPALFGVDGINPKRKRRPRRKTGTHQDADSES